MGKNLWKKSKQFVARHGGKIAAVGTGVATFASARADGADAQSAIVAAGGTVAGYAAAAGAAGVAVMVAIWGIRVAARALKAPK